ADPRRSRGHGAAAHNAAIPGGVHPAEPGSWDLSAASARGRRRKLAGAARGHARAAGFRAGAAVVRSDAIGRGARMTRPLVVVIDRLFLSSAERGREVELRTELESRLASELGGRPSQTADDGRAVRIAKAVAARIRDVVP